MKCPKLALFGAVIASLWLAESAVAQESAAPDIALREFVFNVLSDHPALRQAQAELDAARAQARGQAQPLYNPEIELGYENALDNSKSVGLSQTLDLSGKRGARAGVATAEITAAEARLAIARKTLLADLLVALSDFRRAGRACAWRTSVWRSTRSFWRSPTGATAPATCRNRSCSRPG